MTFSVSLRAEWRQSEVTGPVKVQVYLGQPRSGFRSREQADSPAQIIILSTLTECTSPSLKRW